MYFIANLLVHLFVILALVVLIVICANRNKRGQTKHSLTYFMPFLLAIIAGFYVVKYTAPRLLDIPDVMSQNYYSYTGFVDEVAPLNNYIVIDGNVYYINPLRDLPEPGAYVRVRYTTYSKYAIEVSGAEEVNVDNSVKEEMQTAREE